MNLSVTEPTDFKELEESLRQRHLDLTCRTEKLEEAERTLVLDQEAIKEGFACLRAKVRLTELELALRRQEALDEMSRLNKDVLSTGCDKNPDIVIRNRELNAYSAHLRRERKLIQDQETELAWQRLQIASEMQNLKKERKGCEAQLEEQKTILESITRQKEALQIAQDQFQRIRDEL
jgi:hypothetical protein